MDKIAVGESIELSYLIDYIAKIELDIFTSLMHGSIEYLTSRAIKVKEAYKIPMSSDYAYHELWNDVFGPKYGMAPEPPYGGVRISMNLPNKTAVELWLATLADQDVADRLRKFMDKHDKKGFASIILPHEIVVTSGIPDELKPIVNARKIILANMEPYYILLEMFNVGFLNKWNTKFCLDERLETIPVSLRPYFDIDSQSTLDDIRQQAKRFGVQVEMNDDDELDDELDEDEETT